LVLHAYAERLWCGRHPKAPGKRGQTTANQDRIIAEIKDHWGMAIVVDDVSQLIDYLESKYE
jgi:hypothetical protein